MMPIISQRVRADIDDAVRHARDGAGVVNIATLAEKVRQRNEAENVALEDIAEAMARAAQVAGVACDFDPREWSFSSSVEIVPTDKDWTVHVFENGMLSQQTFGAREWAENFANGQRARLGMPGEDRAQ
jgi:hypothetical protein